MSKSPEELWIEGIDERTADWLPAMERRLKEIPPPGQKNLDDRAFYEAHKQRAEFWAVQGDTNYFTALGIVAPDELERFAKVAREFALEEALRNAS